MERCEFAGINGSGVDDMYRKQLYIPLVISSNLSTQIPSSGGDFTDTFVNRINHLVDEIDHNAHKISMEVVWIG